MNNFDKILSSKLKNDLLSLRDDVFNRDFDSLDNLENHLWSKYIMGCGGPICISDVETTGNLDDFEVYLGIDYKVTYGYKPYQDLNEQLVLSFRVNKESRRDKKIKLIINE